MIFAGIDCGTQGTKVILWDAQRNEIIASSYFTYEVLGTRFGQKEQNPELWLQAIQLGLQNVIHNSGILPSDIVGVGVSGQQHGLVLLDKNNNVLRPAKLWCDTEPVDVLQSFLSEFSLRNNKEVSDYTGIHIPVAFTLAKLLWVKCYEPEIFSKIDKILLPHEYINLWLTGNYCAECGDASGTGYFDTINRCWSKEIVDFLDVKLYEKLPPIIQSHEPAGFVTSEIAQQLGLKEGIPVSSGGGDNMMSAIGTGNILPGILTMSLGTSGTLFTHTDTQVDSRHRMDVNAFCSSSNGWLPLVSTMNVTNAVNSFRQILDIDLADFDDYLEKSMPGAEGLYCFPWFNGSRLPNVPHATASLHGMTSSNFSKANLLRCVVESVTYKICKGIDEFNNLGLAFSQIRVIGGAANSAIWCQIISNITGLDVMRPAVTEAAALGASLQAHWCKENIGRHNMSVPLEAVLPEFNTTDGQIFSPDVEQHKVYQQLYHQFHENLRCYLNDYFKPIIGK